jgi:hypothetical protein
MADSRLKIYLNRDGSYDAIRGNKLLHYNWSFNTYKIYGLKLITIGLSYVPSGKLVRKPHIQMILQVQRSFETNESIMNFNEFVNESVRDKMTPKSKKEIRKMFDHLSPSSKLLEGIEFSLIWLIEESLSEGVDINKWIQLRSMFTFGECNSYIEFACYIGDIEVIKLLLDKGATKSNYNKSACLHNIEYFHDSKKYEKVSKLLIQYEKANEGVKDLMTPKPAEEIRNRLKSTTPEEKLELDFKYQILSDEEYISTLKELPASKKFKYGIHKNYPWLVKLALDDGFNFHDETLRDYSIIDEIIGTKNMEIFNMLVDKFDYNQKAKSLRISCTEGYLDIVKLLIEKGVNVNYGNGVSLREVIRCGHIELVKYLIEHDADVQNAAWSVIAFGQPEILKYLLSKGLNIDTPDGHRGLYDAKEKSNQENYIKTIKIAEEFLRRKKLKKYLSIPMKNYTNESVRDKMTPISDDDFIEKLKSTKDEKELKHFIYLTKGLEEFLTENDMEYGVEFKELTDKELGKDITASIFSIEKSKSLKDSIYPREAYVYITEYDIELELWSGQKFNIIHPKDLKGLISLLIEQGFVVDENQ